MPALTVVSLLERYLVLETAMPRCDIKKTTACTSIVNGFYGEKFLKLVATLPQRFFRFRRKNTLGTFFKVVS
jgi:hypothetical protein